VDGDELLRRKSRPVADITENVKTLLGDMVDTMKNSKGAGLAAPQVGVLKRLIVIDHEDELFQMINPEIQLEEGSQDAEEACLSIPGMIGTVTRPEKLTVAFTKTDGTRAEMSAEGRLAVIISHEVDHLNGVLYRDKARNFRLRTKEDDEEDD
jgi:peptide deformylase